MSRTEDRAARAAAREARAAAREARAAAREERAAAREARTEARENRQGDAVVAGDYYGITGGVVYGDVIINGAAVEIHPHN